MKRITNSIISPLILLSIETIIIVILFFADRIDEFQLTTYDVRVAIRSSMWWSWFRLIFYSPILMIAIFCIPSSVKLQNHYKVPVLNMVVFLLFNTLYLQMDLPSFEYNEFVFWITVASIFISGWLYNKILKGLSKQKLK